MKSVVALLVLAVIAAGVGAGAARRMFDPESTRSALLDPQRIEDMDGDGFDFSFHLDQDELLDIKRGGEEHIVFSRRGEAYTLIVGMDQGTKILERAVEIGFTGMHGRLRVCGTTLLVDPPRVSRNDIPRNVLVSFDISVDDVLDIADCGSFELVTDRGEVRIGIPDGAAESLRWNVKTWIRDGEALIRKRYQGGGA